MKVHITEIGVDGLFWVWHCAFVMSQPTFSLREFIKVVDATAGAKTITFEEGAFELSGSITNDATLALTIQHLPSLDTPPDAVVLPVAVGYSRGFKGIDKQICVMAEIQFTVPEGAIAVFRVESQVGYSEPVVADVE